MVDVEVRTIAAQPIVVAPRSVDPSEVSSAIVPALDAVWQFVRAEGLETGHNVAIYQAAGDGQLAAWFGVEVTSPFEGTCSINCSYLPMGKAAVAVHKGPYDRIGATNQAIRAWCAEQGLALSGTSFEIYGDWTEDPDELETTIAYQLA